MKKLLITALLLLLAPACNAATIHQPDFTVGSGLAYDGRTLSGYTWFKLYPEDKLALVTISDHDKTYVPVDTPTHGAIACLVGAVAQTTSVIVDVNENGTTILGSTKLEIPIGVGCSSIVVPQDLLLAAGSILSCDIDQVDSGALAKGVEVTVW